MKQYLEIGKIVNVHGLRGDVKVVPWCDDPEFLCEFETLYLGREHKPVQVADARLQKGNVLLRLEGVSTVEEAEKLRGHILYMDRDEVELEEGVYFIQDLIGLEVLDADTGASYGKLTDVRPDGCQRCVRGAGRIRKDRPDSGNSGRCAGNRSGCRHHADPSAGGTVR